MTSVFVAPSDVIRDLEQAGRAVLTATSGTHNTSVATVRAQLQSALSDLEACDPIWNTRLSATSGRIRDSILLIVALQQAEQHQPRPPSWWRRWFAA
jgi:hypothetical protein